MFSRTALLTFLSALVLLAVAGTASAAPGALKILNHSTCYASEPETDHFSKFLGQIRAEAGVAEVVESGALPTAAELAQYDGVIVSSNCTYEDAYAEALGNALADYQDAGGAVVALSWTSWNPISDPGYKIFGRWGSTMSPIEIMDSPADPSATVTFSSPHPILAGIGGLATETGYATTLAVGAQSLLDYESGQPAVALKGRAIGVNGLPINAYIDAEYPYGKLTVNAIKVLGRQSVAVKLVGKGSVTSNVGGITCGAICSTALSPGTAVELTAKPAKGNAFTGWAGNCTGNAAKCALAVAYPGTSLTATFVAATPGKVKLKGKTLALKLPGAGKLTVTAPGVKKLGKSVKKGSSLKLKIKPTAGLKKKLAANGKAKLKFKFAFKPKGAAKAVTTTKTLTVK